MLSPPPFAGLAMTNNSRLWLLVNTLAVGVIIVSVAVLVDEYIFPDTDTLTAEQARAALAVTNRVSSDARIREEKGTFWVWIGDHYRCNLSQRTWERSCDSDPILYTGTWGQFEWALFGKRWEAVQTGQRHCGRPLVP
jgi:hypothetical protein